MAYRALDVAEEIIAYSLKIKNPITHLKLQKLLYFVQAKFLLETPHPCFSDKIEAWAFGPVVPNVYKKYKKYSRSTLKTSNNYTRVISLSDLKMIEEMVEIFKDWTPMAMVSLTHRQSPWKDAWDKYGENAEITPEAIKDFFCYE